MKIYNLQFIILFYKNVCIAIRNDFFGLKEIPVYQHDLRNNTSMKRVYIYFLFWLNIKWQPKYTYLYWHYSSAKPTFFLFLITPKLFMIINILQNLSILITTVCLNYYFLLPDVLMSSVRSKLHFVTHNQNIKQGHHHS